MSGWSSQGLPPLTLVRVGRRERHRLNSREAAFRLETRPHLGPAPCSAVGLTVFPELASAAKQQQHFSLPHSAMAMVSFLSVQAEKQKTGFNASVVDHGHCFRA